LIAEGSQGLCVFKDPRDNRVYKTIKIGSQTWFAENLAYKAESGCWAYDNNEANVPKHGRLYTYETAKKICPKGWHLPSKQEYEQLLQSIGGPGVNAYNKLIPSGSSGFNGIFSGFRINDRFEYTGKIAHYWSSTEMPDGVNAWYLGISSYTSDAGINKLQSVKNMKNKAFGFSIRCVKD
jgi:uncharacterized protein (TIGR02145 family)